MLAVVPRLPRFLLLPLQYATTCLCFTVMRRERRAVQRNLTRVTGRTGFANFILSYRLFFNFSRFMVAYAELGKLQIERFRHRVDGLESAQRSIETALAGGNGAILLTMHLGHWDLGLKLLSGLNRAVHVVMMSEDLPEVSRYADEARRFPGLQVHQTGSSQLLAVDLMTALRRGELVAIQADRPAGNAVMDVPFFGAEAPLPTGPVILAMATGAPILPVFVLFSGGIRYRVLMLPPLRFDRVRGDGGAALQTAMERIAAVMESVVSHHPDQWFNFFDVWPQPGEAGHDA